MAKTVLITGGTRGIGAACAQKFYDNGCNIALVYAADDITAQKFVSDKNMSRVLLIKGDVSDYSAMQTVAEDIAKKFGTVDILVNNAGIACQKMINDITEQDWDRMFDVNVKGCFNCVKAVMGGMIHNKYGRIINISSMWGQVGASCEVHYSAAKAAVIGFTKALAKELGPSGITVNCIAPGVIDTDMNNILDRETLDSLAEETPVGRIGTVDDVAEIVMFLSGDGSSFITGQVIGVNGGFVI
jgi:3-oxoacyl-[acyl-carrier protein] reductase